MTETAGDLPRHKQLTEDSPEIEELIQSPTKEKLFDLKETSDTLLAESEREARETLRAAGANPNTPMFEAQVVALAKKLTELKMAAMIDVTGVYNKQGFLMRIQEEADAAQRNGNPYVLASIDLNDLKKINDDKIAGGHPAGDDQLESTATMLKRLSRKSDIVGRLGGDEFGTLLQTDLDGASRWGQRTIRFMANAGISVAIGVATLDPKNIEASWKIADRNMYKAKDGAHKTGLGQYFDGKTTHL